jgi:DNA invertase Pin-like site-specific DNA recombinase
MGDLSVSSHLNGGDWRIISEITEVESGRRADRPELEKALAAARVHRVPVVVAEVDRLTRSVAFLSRLLEAGVDAYYRVSTRKQGRSGLGVAAQREAIDPSSWHNRSAAEPFFALPPEHPRNAKGFRLPPPVPLAA